MSYNETLSLTPEFGLEESIEFRTLITEMEDGSTKTRAKWNYGLRNYKLQLYVYSKTSMDIVWDFFIARKGSYNPFLVKIPTEYQVTSEAIKNGDGVATVFVLDEFPVDTTAGTFTMYVSGSAATATLQNNFLGEYSTVTFAAAPGDGLAITGDYEFLFYVRFASDQMSRQLLAYQLLNAGLELREQRWDVYRPRAGNDNLIKCQVSDSVSISDVHDEYKYRAVDTNDSISITTVFTDSLLEPLGVSTSDSITIAESNTFVRPLLVIDTNDSVSITNSFTGSVI